MTLFSIKFIPLPILLSLLVFLSACKEEEETTYANPTQIDEYFPLSAFLDEKINAVSGDEVVKVISVNGEEEQVSFSPDEEDWKKELDVFIQADINKAALSGAYETRENEDELVHVLKPGEEGNIKELKVKKSGDKVDWIEILSLKENLFYQSQVRGRIQMDAKQEKLASYSLSGKQKVWFLQETLLEVSAEVRE